MKICFSKPKPITVRHVPAAQLQATMHRHFGLSFRLEMVARGFVMTMSEDYYKCPWQLYETSNGSCYVAPQGHRVYRIIGDNDWRGELSADAIGVWSSLLASNFLSFSINLDFAEGCDRNFSALMRCASEHDEHMNILGAFDHATV